MSINQSAPTVFEADLPVLNYELTATPADAWPEFERAQRQAPIAIGPVGPEVLSYDFARAILRDMRFVIPPGINLAAQGITSGALYDKVMETLLCVEGAEHQRLRKLVSKAFTPKATARLHDTMHDVVNGLIDQVTDAGCCDVVADIAVPYPIAIICALLGAPREDWKHFSVWTGDVSKAFSFNVDLAEAEPIVMRAWGELDDYTGAMIDRRRHDLTEDLLSDLIRAEDDGDRLSSEELQTLAASLLMAGTDTTRNQLAASVQVLCEHPEQWALLRDHPERAMHAVEESMRHSPAVCGAPRMAEDDVELGGFVFPSGTILQVNTFAANRDPNVYDDAERFDIRRNDAPAILTFGGGVHYCLGANLARLELAEALTILARRLQNARLSGPAPWKPLLGLSGPTKLPIEFDSACVAAAYP
jgi:cytochrome P450